MPLIKRDKPIEKTRYFKIRLDKNEKNDLFPTKFLSYIKSSLNSNHFSVYPETYKIYLEIAKKIRVNKNNILLTAGADSGIETCFKLFTTPSSKIIKIDSTFKMVDIYSKIYKTKNINIKIDKDLNINYQQFLNNINKKISMIIFANPNSPSGQLINDITIKEILKKSKKYNIPVIIDEAYYEFSEYTALKYLKKFSNLILIRTFSKAYGLAGLRIGYILANQKIIKKLQQYRPAYEVNSISILAANYLLKNYNLVKKNVLNTLEGKKFLIKNLTKNNIQYVECKTNFIHINFYNKKNLVLKHMNKNNILVKDSYISLDKSIQKKFKNYLRISLGPKSLMNKVVKIINKINLTNKF